MHKFTIGRHRYHRPAYLQLSYTPYLFRHSDLPVLNIIISIAFHEKKLKIKKNPFKYCHSEGLFVKGTSCGYFSSIKKSTVSFVVGKSFSCLN